MYSCCYRDATVLMSIGSDPWYHLLTQRSLGWGDYTAVHADPTGISPALWLLQERVSET